MVWPSLWRPVEPDPVLDTDKVDLCWGLNLSLNLHHDVEEELLGGRPPEGGAVAMGVSISCSRCNKEMVMDMVGIARRPRWILSS